MNTVLECLEGQKRNHFEGLILNKVKLSQEDYPPYSPDLTFTQLKRTLIEKFSLPL
jgi:hypothetical protein